MNEQTFGPAYDSSPVWVCANTLNWVESGPESQTYAYSDASQSDLIGN